MDTDKLRLYLAHRIRGLLSGQYASSQLYARGHDLEERRPFRLGDDPRTISLLATAKRDDDNPRVSIHKIDRGANIVFLIDSSASTRFGTLIGKYEYALQLVECIALACLGEGNRFRFLAFDSSMRYDSGYKVTEADINMAIGELALLSAVRCKTDFNSALKYLSNVIGPGPDLAGMIFIISDFIFQHNFSHQLADICESSDVMALMPRDPSELNLPRPRFGLINLVDPETGRSFLARSAANPLDKIRIILKRCEVGWLELSTSNELGTVLEKIADQFEERKET